MCTTGRAWLPLGVFFVLSIFPLSAESGSEPVSYLPYYLIESVQYEIEGRTRERFLAKKVDIEIGRVFPTQEALEEYLQSKKQLLINQRVLAEAEVSYSTSPRTDGGTGVHVLVKTQDTWNFIVLPYFKYDSNSGLLLSLRTRDFNFLGSMETLKLDFDYTITSSRKNEFGQSAEFIVPFRMLGQDFTLGLDEEVTYNANDNRLEFDSTVSLGIELLFLGREWTLETSQGYFYDNKDFYGDTHYYETKVSFGTAFETPITLRKWAPFLYAPEVYIKANYRPDKELTPERRGYGPGFYHELKAERIDWIGDFRNGGSVSLGNDLYYNIQKEDWDNKLTWDAVGHKAFSWMGFSTRLSGFFQFNKELGIDPDDDVGESIRGILDDRLVGDMAIFLNTDILIKMWTWFLDRYFEVQGGPFFDYALTKRRGHNLSFDDSWYGGGIQVIIFPRFARSLYIRGSLGWDLEAVLDDHKLTGNVPRDEYKRYEIFFGLGHHY
ncbi:MAG TPA: hypothetical protein PLG79_13600 [Spirochaetales bacterium]|nr:hypothetical protein [Spirochaetales bacterium]